MSYPAIPDRAARVPWDRPSLLPALNPQIDLHPFVVLLQDVVVFAQRMSLPSIRQKNSLQIRMPVELDPEHVKYFALQPVRRRPDGHGTRQTLSIRDLRFHADPLVPRKRIKHPDDVERFLTRRIMHRGDVYAI